MFYILWIFRFKQFFLIWNTFLGFLITFRNQKLWDLIISHHTTQAINLSWICFFPDFLHLRKTLLRTKTSQNVTKPLMFILSQSFLTMFSCKITSMGGGLDHSVLVLLQFFTIWSIFRQKRRWVLASVWRERTESELQFIIHHSY